MEHMRRIAYETVLRACGFRFARDLLRLDRHVVHAEVRVPGWRLPDHPDGARSWCSKAYEANSKDYRRTEMWLYLEKDQRPPAAYAQWASATVLRETYLRFAMWTSAIAIVMWVIALVLALAGI